MSDGWGTVLSAIASDNNEARQRAVSFIDEYQHRNVQEMMVSVLAFVNSAPSSDLGYLGLVVILRSLRTHPFCSTAEFGGYWMDFLKSVVNIRAQWPEQIAIVNVISDIIAEIGKRVQFIDIVGFLFEYVKCIPEMGLPITSTVIQRTNIRIPTGAIVEFLEFRDDNRHLCEAKVSILINLLAVHPKDEDLNCMFAVMLESQNTDLASVELDVLFDHIHLVETFIESHLQKLLQFLETSLQVEALERRAVLLLAKLCCVKSFPSGLLSHVIQLLATRLSNYDGDEDSVYQLARLCVGFICENVDGREFMSILRGAQIDVVAMLSIICELREPVISMIGLAGQYVDLVKVVSQALSHSSVPIHILSLEAIEHLCRSFGPIVITECFDSLLGIFEGFVPRIGDLAAPFVSALGAFFSKLPVELVCPRVLNLLAIPMQMAACKSLHRHVSVCLEQAISSFPSSLEPVSENLIKIMLAWLESGDYDSVIAAVGLASYFIRKLPVPDKKCFIPLWRAAFAMRQQAPTGEDIYICDQAVYSLTGLLSELIWDEMKCVVPSLIEGSNQELSVSAFTVEDGIKAVAGFRQVVCNDPTKIVFVNESSAATILSYLKLLLTCIDHFTTNYLSSFGEATINVCTKWITHPVLEVSIKRLCWIILERISKHSNILTLVADMFIATVELFHFNSYVEYAEKSVVRVLVDARFELDPERTKTIATILLQKVSQSSNEETFDHDPFELETLFFTQMITTSPSGPSICQSLLEPIVQTLANESTAGFGVATLSRYFVATRECSIFLQFTETAFSALTDVEDHLYLSLHAIHSLAYILEHMPTDPTFTSTLTTHLVRILSHKDSYENDALIFFDSAVYAFIKLNPPPESLPTILRAMPLTISNSQSRAVITHTVNMIASLPREVFTPELLTFLQQHLTSPFTTPETHTKIETLLHEHT